jgi:hypothetical protein
VIKNINVKEKMWDEGEVVNAELSFTLEQIPEWTINDGAYVDVARPGRRPLQEQVANFASGTAAGPAETVETETETEATPGGGTSESQTASNPNTPPRSLLSLKCQFSFDYTANLKDLQKRARGTRAMGANEVYEIQASEFFTMLEGINSSAGYFFRDSSGQAFSTRNDVDSFKAGWKKAKEGDLFGLKRKNWLETRIQTVVDRQGAGWNNKDVCPNTAR